MKFLVAYKWLLRVPLCFVYYFSTSKLLHVVFQVFLTEIGSRFVPLPEERLLAIVHALLHRCYKYPTATTAEVPQSLKKELSGVCRACFSADTVNKHVEFVNEYKWDFERDLDPESTSTFPATITWFRFEFDDTEIQIKFFTWFVHIHI